MADVDSADQSFGLMRIGEALLALPVVALREVTPCPATFAALPIAVSGLLGALELRGAVIPVLDLRTTLGLPMTEPSAHVIVIMRHEGRLLGLLADGVAGMARVPTDRLHTLSMVDAGTHPNLATHTFQLGDRVATLLDAARICALPGVPTVPEQTTASHVALRKEHRQPLLMFRSGGIALAVSAMWVDATVPRTELRTGALNTALCRGVIDHHGSEVPVIDTLMLLGLGSQPPVQAQASAVLVLRFPEGRLSLMLDEVCDIVPVAASDILPLPALAVKRPELFGGVLAEAQRGQSLLIDIEALARDPILQSLASLSRRVASAAKPVATAAAAVEGKADAASAERRVGVSHVTFQIDVEIASPLAQLSEIVPYPTHATPLRAGPGNAVLGLFTHRGAAVPLLCLGSLLGRPQVLDLHNARVLLVEDGERLLGFAVQHLCSIEEVRWAQPATARSMLDAPTLAAVCKAQPLVEVGLGAKRRTLPRLDLHALARALRPAVASEPSATIASCEPVASAAITV